MDGKGFAKLRRRLTNPSEIRSTIINPGDVRINVTGAFIVEDEATASDDRKAASTSASTDIGVSIRTNDYEQDPNNIRLPNHNSVVSHVAVDVGCCEPATSGDKNADLLPFCPFRLEALWRSSFTSRENRAKWGDDLIFSDLKRIG